jgi:hypothetical protein
MEKINREIINTPQTPTGSKKIGVLLLSKYGIEIKK